MQRTPLWLLTAHLHRSLAQALLPRGVDPPGTPRRKACTRDSVLHNAHGVKVSRAAPAGGTAVISNPASFEAVVQIAAHGERVPRKSTSFGPKPRTGLILRTFGPSD